mmetsp:Transcript_9887/g.14290  ORF Transcript_9887/g.14290 Transcript_9887/m.14290 type:complete len:386 (+) Transcript_9887:115-1272(+)
MPHLSKNCQGGMLCRITPSTASSKVPELGAKEASPYRCSDANTHHDYTLDDEWSKVVRLSHASGATAKFPEKLYLMLEDIYKSGDESIVSWQPHGRAFRVHKKLRFVETVLPKFFGHSKYTSFTRQLNLYGFHRIKVGQDKGAYYHELFLRSQPYRCREMVRQLVKGNSSKGFAYSEPNFYAMPPSNMLINGSYDDQHKAKASALLCSEVAHASPRRQTYSLFIEEAQEVSPVVYSQGSAEALRLTSLMDASVKPAAVPKPDTKKKVFLEEGPTGGILAMCTTPTSSKSEASTIQNNIAWMDSFPLLCGLPCCQEPTGSFVSSLLESKDSDQMQLRNFDEFSFCSDNSFCKRIQDQDTLCVEDIQDLLKFDDFQEENDLDLKSLI